MSMTDENITRPGSPESPPCWSFLALLIVPVTTLICNFLFITSVRYNKCFSSPASHYVISLCVGQIILSLVNQIPTVIIYIHGTTGRSNCYYLVALDVLAVTLPSVHFLAILFHQLIDYKYFQFLSFCYCRIPHFIAPWSVTMFVTLAVVVEFSLTKHYYTRGKVVCLLNRNESWIWIIPLTLYIIVILLSLGLFINQKRVKNSNNGISIVNRCSGDWTKSMALVFIDPHDLVNTEGENYAITDSDEGCSHNSENAELTVINENADICEAILEGYTNNSRSQTNNCDVQTTHKKHSNTNIEEELTEPDTNALLLNDTTVIAVAKKKSPITKSVGSKLKSCKIDIITVLLCIFIVFQFPFIVTNAILCVTNLIYPYALLINLLKWLALLPGLLFPILHIFMSPHTYKVFIMERIRLASLNIGQLNRYQRT